MTTYTAPPDRSGLVLNSGDILNVNAGGRSNFTTVNNGGIENVYGDSHATTVDHGGVQNVFGRSVETEIDKGGVENVQSGGLAVRTYIPVLLDAAASDQSIDDVVERSGCRSGRAPQLVAGYRAVLKDRSAHKIKNGC